MLKIDAINTKTDNIIATSYIGGMLFPANGIDHPLLMAYYLKWGLHLSDGESLDTTQEVIDYLLEKISDLNNRIANLEDQTEYTITVSSSSKAKCDLTKIKKSGGTVTITPNSGYKITGVQPTNCSITHIDNTNKYNISNITGNIILDVLTNEVDIQIEQLLSGNTLTINRPVNYSNVIEIVSQTGGGINPTTIFVDGTSSIIEPEKITVKYENLEGSKALTFKGSDINAKPTITKVNKLEYSNLTTSGVTLSTNGYAETGTLTITFNDKNGLYNKEFNVQVSITNDDALEDVSSGWQYHSADPDVAEINYDDLTITGIKLTEEPINITIYYLGKWLSIGQLTVTAESKKYYWYVGQENPANMTSISPIVADNASPGWRLIGTSVPTYSASNKLWDGVTNGITFNARDIYYYAVPSNNIKIYDDTGASVMDVFTTSEVTIEGVKYYVYTSNSKARGIAWMVY